MFNEKAYAAVFTTGWPCTYVSIVDSNGEFLLNPAEATLNYAISDANPYCPVGTFVYNEKENCGYVYVLVPGARSQELETGDHLRLTNLTPVTTGLDETVSIRILPGPGPFSGRRNVVLLTRPMKISTFFTVILFVAATSISCGGNSARTLRAADGGKPKMLWFDAEANFKRFASQDSIRYYLDRTVECGFNHIVVDVRPISGTVLYESDMLEPLTVVGPDTVRRDWDYLQCFLDEARKRELKVTVSTMIFPAGFTTFRQGAAYSDPELAGRTCVEYTPEGRKDIKDDPTKVAAFLNPVLPENQEYVLRFAHELLTKYKFDGYALDYCRFPDAESDFSPASREAFETYLGHGIDRFPEDIFTYDANGARVAGPYYKQWWEFRSGVIRDFIAEVRTLIERTQPGVKLEYWAASWLHAIYTQGQNWASPRSRFHEAYLDDWATPTYNRTGFADLLDVFITGTYLEKVWGMDDPESIEYGLARSLKDVDGDCAVYGSLYAQNHVDQFEDAVYLCLSRTDGVMVFDIIQVIENDLWDDIKRGIDRAEKEQKTQK